MVLSRKIELKDEMRLTRCKFFIYMYVWKNLIIDKLQKLWLKKGLYGYADNLFFMLYFY